MLIDLYLCCCCCLCLCLCFFFFLINKIGRIWPKIRPRSGWMGPAEARRGEYGAKKKTRLLNGPSPGNRGRPTGRVRVSKNPPQTRPVAIPMFKGKRKKAINILTAFFIFHKSDVKTFLKWILNKCP